MIELSNKDMQMQFDYNFLILENVHYNTVVGIVEMNKFSFQISTLNFEFHLNIITNENSYIFLNHLR